jgi:hypothetical protein
MQMGMSFRKLDLGMLEHHYQTQARALILDAYRRADGKTIAAAKILEIGRRTLQRWTTELKLRADIDAIRVAHGDRPSATYNPAGQFRAKLSPAERTKRMRKAAVKSRKRKRNAAE